jgi:glycosyltransferase involved in cell wall biosynthesis
MNVVYAAQFNDASGYGSCAREYLKLFDKYNKTFNLFVLPVNFEKQNYASEEEQALIDKYSIKNIHEFLSTNKDYIYLHHLLPSLMTDKNGQLSLADFLNNASTKINMVAWETDRLPKPWVQIYKTGRFDKIITFCQYTKDAILKDLNIPLSVIPHILDVSPQEKIFNTDKFKLFCMSQWGQRKGFDILIKTFFNTFFDNPDVELIIKTYKNETVGSSLNLDRELIIAEATKYKTEVTRYGDQPKCKLKIIPSFLTKEEVNNLYRTSDVYISTTRGEGFGLTIAEASIMGLPLIVPNKGGHIDCIDITSNYCFDVIEQPCFGMGSLLYSSVDMNNYEPLIQSVSEKMKEAYNDWKLNKLQNVSEHNKKYTAKELNQQQIFDKFMEVIK